MKGLVLAGGAGTRLRPITHTSSKQLVPVANKPILFYGIEAMAAAGIVDIGIIVGDTADEVVAAVGDGSKFGVAVTYIRQAEPLGLAHCVLIARDFLGDDEFVMYLGDNMLQQRLSAFIEHFDAARPGDGELPLGQRRHAVAQVLLSEVSEPQRFGVAAFDDAGHLVRLVEKPIDPPSNLALVGVYLFTSAIHDAVAAIEPSARGELEITDAIQWLIDRGDEVRHEVLEGWWIDTGKKDPLLESNRRVLELLERSLAGIVDESSVIDGRVVVEAGAEIIESEVRGPAVIGSGTRIVRSYVGPYTAIGPGCEVVDSEVEQSVILEGTSITGVHRIMDSLIGRNAIVKPSPVRPRATRLLLGDDSVVEL